MMRKEDDLYPPKSLVDKDTHSCGTGVCRLADFHASYTVFHSDSHGAICFFIIIKNDSIQDYGSLKC